jgi:hypothetical protein
VPSLFLVLRGLKVAGQRYLSFCKYLGIFVVQETPLSESKASRCADEEKASDLETPSGEPRGRLETKIVCMVEQVRVIINIYSSLRKSIYKNHLTRPTGCIALPS